MNCKLVLLFCFIALLTCVDGVSARDSDFYLTLHLERKERSKDSSSRTTELRIAKGVVNYSVRYGGRNPTPDKKGKYALSKSQETQLIEYIIKHKLNRNIRERKPEASPGRSINLHLNIKMGKSKTRARITGATRFWGRKGKTTNLKHKAYCRQVHSLLVFMKRKLGFKDIKL